MYHRLMATITASTARQTLPAQLDRVEAGEEVSITRHGRVIAVLVSPHALRQRRASGAWNDADRLQELLDDARNRPLPQSALPAERADELVAGIRADRGGR